MNHQAELLFKERELKVELKGYKELPTCDGYHMQGSIYINGKKAFFCEDKGFGGGCDITIINNDQASLILNLKPDFEQIQGYPDSETLQDVAYNIEIMFYEMAEDFLIKKEFKKNAKSKTLIRWEGKEYAAEEYSYIKATFSKAVLEHIKKQMLLRKMTTVQLWNVEENWKTYTVKEIEEIIIKKLECLESK